MSEMKFYLKRSKIDALSSHNGMPWDYPMFIMFTDEDLERIQRNYLDAQMNGLSPDIRKVCITLNCEEGYTYRDLLEEMKKIPECSEEEFKFCIDIPHWNPIDTMDEKMQRYCDNIKMVKESNDGILRDDPETKANLEAFITKIDDTRDLPNIPYERRA